MVRVRGEPQPQADTLACTVRIRTRTDPLEAHLRPSSGGGGAVSQFAEKMKVRA